MIDTHTDEQDRWLCEQFSRTMPELPDDGFSRSVLGRIRRRALLRNALPVAGLLVGIGLVAWPAAELIAVIGSHLPTVGHFDWQQLFEANKTLVLGLLLCVLSPLLVALLED
jgi:hypothetical protein